MVAAMWQGEAITAAEEVLRAKAAALRTSGISVETRVAVGPPSRVILDTARDAGVTLVVVGTHGKKGLALAFLGSVAETVVRSASCPVLVAPPGATVAERWQERQLVRVLVATDGAGAGSAALAWVGVFSEATPCDLSVLRVYSPLDEALRYGLEARGDASREGAEIPALVEARVREETRALTGHPAMRVRLRPAQRDGSEAVNEEAALLGADLIVLGVPRRHIFRSTLLPPDHVLRRSTLPVLCVPETGTPALHPLAAVPLANGVAPAPRNR